MSSPVSLRGAGNQSTRPSSSDLAALRIADAAQRGGSAACGRGGAQRIDQLAGAAAPKTRTTATPARPGAVDRAKIVATCSMHLDWSRFGVTRSP